MTVIAAPGAADTEILSTGPSGRSTRPNWPRWRAALIISVVVFLGGIAIAALHTPPATSYLDPGSTSPAGARAVADLLAGRGTQVVKVTSASEAAEQVSRGATTIVVTSPGLMSGQQLRRIGATKADLVVIEPDRLSLSTLAPGLHPGSFIAIGPRVAGCHLAAAALAGIADMGGTGLRPAPGVHPVACYRTGRLASLVQYSAGARQVTVLGTGTPLQNHDLASLGNAALALNLLSHRGRIAWLVPAPTAGRLGTSGPKSLWQLIPLGAYLVALQLGIAVLLTAAWRARRLGPLVAEQLPVVVPAAETTEGHARLYQARRARDRAAAALRTATLDRIANALGIPANTPEHNMTAALALRVSSSQDALEQLLYGPPPTSDGALIALANGLTALEEEILAR